MNGAHKAEKRSEPGLRRVSTCSLREKLSFMYARSKLKNARFYQPRYVDYLWDLKETALVTGETSVEVPEEWLKELEQFAGESSTSAL